MQNNELPQHISTLLRDIQICIIKFFLGLSLQTSISFSQVYPGVLFFFVLFVFLERKISQFVCVCRQQELQVSLLIKIRLHALSRSTHVNFFQNIYTTLMILFFTDIKRGHCGTLWYHIYSNTGWNLKTSSWGKRLASTCMYQTGLSCLELHGYQGAPKSFLFFFLIQFNFFWCVS